MHIAQSKAQHSACATALESVTLCEIVATDNRIRTQKVRHTHTTGITVLSAFGANSRNFRGNNALKHLL